MSNYTTEDPKQLGRQPKGKQQTKKRRATWQEPTTSTVIQARKKRSGALQPNSSKSSGTLPVPVVWLRIKPGTSPSPNKIMRDRMVEDKAPGESRVTNPRSSYRRKPQKKSKVSLCEIHAFIFQRIMYTPHIDSALYAVKSGVISQKVSLHG